MPATKKRLTPEQKLANYWRKKTGQEWVDFDIFQKEAPAGTYARNREEIVRYEQVRPKNEKPFGDIMLAICHTIAAGFPLSYNEYHLALAGGVIIGEVPYEEFFRKHWHEDEKIRGYSRL